MSMQQWAVPPPDAPSTFSDDEWSVIVPDATTNMITNPSAETNINGHTPKNGATLTRVIEQQRRGAYSIRCAPSSAVNSGHEVSTAYAAAGLYTASLDVRGSAGRLYWLDLYDTGPTLVARTEVLATGRWQRIVVTGRMAGASGAAIVQIVKANHANTEVFYTDGWQLEYKSYPTTYCDGDMRGAVIGRRDFGWLGTPHASVSYRTAATRQGGREMNFKKMGFLLLGVLGLTSLNVQHHTIPLSTGGSVYQTSVGQPTDFSLTGRMAADKRTGLLAALAHTRTFPPEPLELTYTPMADDDTPRGDSITMQALFQPNGGDVRRDPLPTMTLPFALYIPLLVSDGTVAIQAQPQATLAFTQLVARTPDHQWVNYNGGASAFAILPMPNGDVYIGGTFTTVNGGAMAVNRFARRTVAGAWSSFGIGVGANNTVRALALLPDGRIVIGGDFTSIGGVAANGIALYNPATTGYNTVASLAIGASVQSLVVDPAGVIYAGGSNLTAAGRNVAQITTTGGLVALGGVFDNTVYSVSLAPNGDVVAGGQFTTIGALSAAGIARWNGTTWAALGAGIPFGVTAVGHSPTGQLVATRIGSATTPMAWDGTTWNALGNRTFSSYSLVWDSDGTLLIGSEHTIVALRGGVWVDLGFRSNLAQTQALALASDGTLLAAVWQIEATAQIEAITNVANPGTGLSGVVWTITGPPSTTATVTHLRNESTDTALYLDLTLQLDEIVTITLTDTQLSAVSNLRGDVWGAVLGGSQPSEWQLLPGQNRISVWASTATITATLQWQPTYQSLLDSAWDTGR